VQILSGSLKIESKYSFSNDVVRLDLPRRAKLTALSSPGKGTIPFYNNQNSIRLDHVSYSYGGKIELTYTIPLTDFSFSSEDWFPVANEKGMLSVILSEPKDYQSFVVPYESRGKDGFMVNPDDKPVLICGRYQTEETQMTAAKYEIHHQGRLNFSVTNIAELFGYYEKALFPLEQKERKILILPSVKNSVFFGQNSIFIILNNASSEEIKKITAGIWFKNILKWNEQESFAFTDFYRRLIDENGHKRTDDVFFIPVPSRKYYQAVLEKGFAFKGEIFCDVDSMLKNFALLHLAYYTLGMDNFLDFMRDDVLSSKPSHVDWRDALTNAFDDTSAALFITEKLLPGAKFLPDLSLKNQMAYRNDDSFPDISLRIDGTASQLSWNNKRVVDIGTFSNEAILDPERQIPQINFYNDISIAGQKDKIVWDLAYQALIRHRHYGDETIRQVLSLDKFQASAKNAFGLPKDALFFVGVVQFYAPVNGRLVNGLKEVLITIKEEKAVVIADRIRI
jgi:hypothetical protein